MSDTKHTPGPWIVTEYDGRGPMEIQSSEYPGAGLVLVYAAHPETELQANAALIASAPDLLSRNQELEEENKRLKAEISDARRDREGVRESLSGGIRQMEELLTHKDRELSELRERANKYEGAYLDTNEMLLRERENVKTLREALSEALAKIQNADYLYRENRLFFYNALCGAIDYIKAALSTIDKQTQL